MAQVRYSDMPPSVLAAAKQLGGGRAQPALELVGYEPEVEAAIRYTFGNAFICQVSTVTGAAGQHRLQLPE